MHEIAHPIQPHDSQPPDPDPPPPAQFAQDPRARVEYVDSSFGTPSDGVKRGRIDAFMTGRLEGAAKRNGLAPVLVR